MTVTTRILICIAVVAPLLASDEASAQSATDKIVACYHPTGGLIYRVNEPGLPSGCLGVRFAWSDDTTPGSALRVPGRAGSLGTGGTRRCAGHSPEPGPQGEQGGVGPQGHGATLDFRGHRAM